MPAQNQPLTNKQHAVPQNIMDVEFKLIGELTMRQFVYVLVFAIAAYMAKLSVPQPFTWFFVIGLGLTGLGFAFVPYEDRGLDEWVINFLKAINIPTERIWKKEWRIPVGLAYEQSLHFVQQELITLAPTASRRKLEEYLDQRGRTEKKDPLDIPEEAYIAMVREAFKTEERTVAQRAQPTTLTPAKGTTIQSAQPSLETREKLTRPTKEAGKKEDMVGGKEPMQAQDTTSEEQHKETKKKELEKSERETAAIARQTKINKIVEAKIKKSKMKPLDEGKSRGIVPLRPLMQHSGRKFVNLTLNQGRIVLPIRGEKVIQISREDDRTIEEKNKKMRKLLSQTQREKEMEKKLSVRQIPSMVKRPNIVSGMIKNRRGEHIQGVVIVIKNEKGEPVRALKTDKVGRFLVSTPLANGKYKLEVDGAKQTNLAFDIIPLEIKGGLLPSFEIIGR